MSVTDTILVVPCFRDGERLAVYLPELCAALGRSGDVVLVRVVDDGSPAAEQAALARVVEHLQTAYPFLQPLVANPENHGKGHAIRTGWAKGPPGQWLAFVDADGAVPAAGVAAFIARARAWPQHAMHISDRTAAQTKDVHRFWHRRAGSRLFNAWVRFCLGLDLSDTQCGLKVIPVSFNDRQTWREDGFAFDLELLLRARAVGLPIASQPIAWHEKPGSTLGPKAMLGLFAAAWRLRRSRS